MKSGLTLLYISIAAVLGVAVVDFLFIPSGGLAFLPVLVFWAAVVQGAVALCAAAEISNGKWLEALKRPLLKLYPLTLLLPAGFLLFLRHMEAYPWYQHPNAWLDPTFFTVRNVLISLLPFITAHVYARAVEKETDKKNRNAVVYLLAFVVSQCFIAFDWIMTFDYPFINTLFGGFFFIEALYLGVALCAIMAGIMIRKSKKTEAVEKGPDTLDVFKALLKDSATFLMGLALFWVGLFYSQYLVIWYGNIPEEVVYLTKRLHDPVHLALGIFVLFALFIGPFFLLIPRRVKILPGFVIGVALLVGAGVLLERVFFLVTVAPVNIPVFLFQFIIFGWPIVFAVRGQLAESTSTTTT